LAVPRILSITKADSQEWLSYWNPGASDRDRT